MEIIYRIQVRAAAVTILLIAGISLIFHLFIITGVIPFKYVWGGRLETYEQMITFEIISMGINGLIIFIASMKAQYIKPYFGKKTLKYFCGLFTVIFILNTLGNSVAISSLESKIATPLTFLMAVLFLRLTLDKS